MGNTTYDPFDVSHTDQPYQGDMLNPDFARNLMAFGAATMQGANARTGGGFLANGVGPFGPIGAGIQGAMEQNMAAGRNRAAIGLTNAETQGKLLNNQIAAMGIPYQQGLMELRTRLMNDPNFARQYMMQMGMGGDGGGAAPSGGGDYASKIAGMESSGRGNDATNPLWPVDKGGPLGMHQFTAETWQQFAKATPQFFQNMTPQQVLAARTDPGLSTAATNWYRSENTPILQAAGVAPTDQNLAIAHTLGGAAAAKVLSAPDDTPLSRVIPGTIPQNPQYGKITVGQLKQKYGVFGGAPSQQQGSMPPPYQVASVGGTPSPGASQGASSGAAPQQMAQAGPGQQLPPQAGVQTAPNAYALSQAQIHTDRANAIKRATGLGLPTFGDEAAERQQAQAWLETAVAGTKAGAESAAKLPNTMEVGRPGSVIYQGGVPIGATPLQSDEVVTEGPNKGMHVKVFRDPRDGHVIGTQLGEASVENYGNAPAGLPPGAVPSSLSPQVTAALENVPKIEREAVDKDRAIVEGDLGHVIENAAPAQSSLRQIRNLTPEAATGAAGPLRAEIKNWVQTFAPDLAGQIDFNASPAQQMQKLSLLGAGRQERGDVGARGGFRLTELYLKANPGLEMQPDANIKMANSLLVSHQYHIDYANGASDFQGRAQDAYLANPVDNRYQILNKYDNAFTKAMRPELYVAATDALNGKKYDDWTKDLGKDGLKSSRDLQIIAGIVQRVDPSAMIDIKGQKVRADAIRNTIGPADVGPKIPGAI